MKDELRTVRVKYSLDGKYKTSFQKFHTSTTEQAIRKIVETRWFPGHQVIVYQIYRY